MEEKNTNALTAPAAGVSSQDTLTPLKTSVAAGAGSLNRCSNPDFPCAVHRPSLGRTPPATPPGRSASPCSSQHVAGSPHSSASGGSPHAAGKGVAAPASVVDDVMEKFGRPRARSLSRSDRRMSLPAWKEESDEGPPPAPMMDDRRRALSMSAAESMRDRKPSTTNEAFAVRKQCRDCHLSASFAMEGEPASFCRTHQMAGMVNVLMEGCDRRGCGKAAAYGFHGKGRQRCFTHKEEDMVHVLREAIDEGSVVVGGEPAERVGRVKG